ncbi:MAG: DinB family protein, partial [Calditrichaeota bacterium]|nr:DinB family protein [Calditrichota bacterium]
DICAEFHQHSNSLVALIKTINQLDLKSIIISSPVNPNIVLSAEKALQIIVDHGQRHINQAIEVTKQLSINA